MVKLFLCEPKRDDDSEISITDTINPLVKELDSLIRSLVTDRGRSEARLWLCSTIAGASITHKQTNKIFMSLLRSKPRKLHMATRLLQLILEKKPRKLGAVLAKRSYILEKFFSGNSNRILQWFSDFALDGGSDHKRGAKALAQFAFTNRDICWEELQWRGRHGQSPAVVATKPHYLLDLDVERTIENFLDNVPEFWSSNEFAESLRDGQIIFLDTNFFLDLFIRFMYNYEEEDEEDDDDVWDVVDDFLMEESFSSLSRHLLITLEEHDLCLFLDLLCDYIDQTVESDESAMWAHLVLSKYSGKNSMDELLVLNSVINQGRKLVRLVCDDNVNDEQDRMRDIVRDICMVLDNGNGFCLAVREFSKMKSIEAIRSLGILSWIVQFRLSEEHQTPDSWESLFKENGIEFCRSNDHLMLSDDGSSWDDESDDGRRHKKGKRKRRKRTKKKKKKERSIDLDLSDDEHLHLLPQGLHHGNRNRSWLLSTDGFTTTWTSVDLPEYISRYCLSVWMKKIVARQNNEA